MKIKNSYYCIVDRNNKPDLRFLFEDKNDAQRKIKQIKNSTKGETLIFPGDGRDFFATGVKKELINPKRKISIKKGCWTGLRVVPLKMMEDFDPTKVFHRIVKSEENQLYYSKQREKEVMFQNFDVKIPVLPNPLVSVDWENSFLKTKAFMASLLMMCAVTVASVVFIQKNTTDKIANELTSRQNEIIQKTVALQTKVMGEKDQKLAQQFDSQLDNFVLEALKNFDSIKQESLEEEIMKMVGGTPMEKMVPLIAKQDRVVAAFLVGIAKKESNYGIHVPLLDGQDCYNYWGYRGIRARMGTGGHTCFDSPEDAVETVAGRIQELVKADVDTPQEMVLWKCGSNCANDSGASKWISDVGIYFNQLNNNQGG